MLYLEVLCDTDGIRCTDLREAIEDCGTDFELGYLTIEGARHDALAEQFDTVHFRFDEAAAVIAAPFLPDGASRPFDRPERFIAGSRAGAILFPRSPVAADRNDRMGPARSYRGMALSGVVCAVATDMADLLILRDLRQQIGEHRGITNCVGCDFDCSNVERSRVNPDMHLAPLRIPMIPRRDTDMITRIVPI